MFDGNHARTESLTDLSAFSGTAGLGQTAVERVPSPPEDLVHAFNANQIASKTWLVDRVYETFGGNFATVYVLGGWYGALGALLLDDPRYRVGRVLSIDIDPTCAEVAERVNAEAAAGDRFRAVTGDAATIDYRPAAPSDLVINTSCEHMADTGAWFDRIPRGAALVLQSNDYFDCPEHVNCVADLAAFKAQVPMSKIHYEGTLKRRRYSRFMLIGRR